ncbi:hypothetical protein [Streptomyces sp. MMG1121]|uniref:hypothetical protein n=1 Tax=Streptomyces sp. MMG1121 TaxID=1415544 RepID=UPI00131BC652|nr:hypothetical protein [Streptomyces sp. MMG1121]
MGGNRNVNSILRIVHVTQVRCHEPVRTYVVGKIAESSTKSHVEARLQGDHVAGSRGQGQARRTMR